MLDRLSMNHLPVEIEACLSAAHKFPRLDSDYGYELHVDASSVRVRAREDWGVLAALSTLDQLREGREIPRCVVEDFPKFRWRGLMLDPARRFISPRVLQETLDLMFQFRLNVLHLHLTDDQGFRFGTSSFPQLVSKEHYSPQELASLVEAAADRGIRVIPEIDMPGHCSSWIRAIPEWGAVREEVDTRQFGVQRACLDVSSPEVRSAVEKLLGEVAVVFPDEFVHVGGDEVVSDWWDRSERVRGYKRLRGIRSNHDLQADFNHFLQDVLRSLDRASLAWDEALHPSLPKDFAVQSWRSLGFRDAALQAGHSVVASAPYYLDLNYPADVHYRYRPDSSLEEARANQQSERDDDRLAHVVEGVAWGTGPFELPSLPNGVESGELLGGEACMWAELVPEGELHRRVWSRMPLIAERFWNGVEAVSETDAYRRMRHQHRRLETTRGFVDLGRSRTEGLPESMLPLLQMLEPVKWYARHLGPQSLRARLEGADDVHAPRPYDASSCLDQIVDRLVPESMFVRDCMEDVRSARDLSRWTSGWRSQNRNFASAVQSHPELAVLEEASDALALLADVAEGTRTADRSLAGPYGEVLLPVVYAFCDRGD